MKLFICIVFWGIGWGTFALAQPSDFQQFINRFETATLPLAFERNFWQEQPILTDNLITPADAEAYLGIELFEGRLLSMVGYYKKFAVSEDIVALLFWMRDQDTVGDFHKTLYLATVSLSTQKPVDDVFIGGYGYWVGVYEHWDLATIRSDFTILKKVDYNDYDLKAKRKDKFQNTIQPSGFISDK